MEAEVRDADSRRVQVVERAFALLDVLVAHGGCATAGQLKSASGLAGPTVHRLLHTLVGIGVVHQLNDRRYALGANLVPLGESATRQLGGPAVPQMQALVAELGESVNLAAMESEMIVYIGQVPSPHTMRMFTEVGRRAHLHSTGVGKALLAGLEPSRVRELLAATGMPALTEKTLTRPQALLDQLPRIAAQGYALDDEEQEMGVRCLAVVVPNGPSPMGLSVSGPTGRMDDGFVRHAVPLMRRSAAEIGRRLGRLSPRLG
ncbi:IclR family transcriptional regulator [Nesterenkonia lutea]|uniref:IclR family acetate operon transcriptional repressor n=1 Tax=Nesterenkonia lutea TaxID=272919 RepID=A0ABR9JAC7_9MICC|nr:IclR family transcriptional regulator [Nesterenkonia lutea]MBE1522886.1 IclR family acetate operon transcriptional repressor [Nesterenkonia lutea]